MIISKSKKIDLLIIYASSISASFLGSLVAAYQVSYIGNHPLSFDEIIDDLKST